MDRAKPLIDRERVAIWDRWWLSTGIGCAAFAVAFATVTEGVPGEPWQMSLFSLGIFLAMLDGLSALRVVSYATMGGPDEQCEEAKARFLVWERAKWRYGIAAILSMSAGLMMPSGTSDGAGVAAVLAPCGIYIAVWACDIYRSIQEAKRLFPSKQTKSRR